MKLNRAFNLLMIAVLIVLALLASASYALKHMVTDQLAQRDALRLLRVTLVEQRAELEAWVLDLENATGTSEAVDHSAAVESYAVRLAELIARATQKPVPGLRKSSVFH